MKPKQKIKTKADPLPWPGKIFLLGLLQAVVGHLLKMSDSGQKQVPQACAD